MKLTDALDIISSYGVFCATSFNNTSSASLTVQKNILSKVVNITNGTNKIGHLNPYNFKYSIFGNDITLRNTTTWNGSIGYSDSINSDSSVICKNFKIIQENSLDVQSVSDQILGYSNYLSTLPSNTISTLNSTELVILGRSQTINVVNFNEYTISKLNDSESIVINIPKSSILIINILTNQHISLANKVFNYNSSNSSRVLFNFIQGSVEIVGEFEPTILAINSTVSINNSTTYGQIIANNVFVAGTVDMYSKPFNGYTTLPIAKLQTNNIDRDLDIVTITNPINDSSIFYSINKSNYIQYTNDITVNLIGDIRIDTYSSKVGYLDSDITTYNFSLSCECEKPIIVNNDNTITISSNTIDAVIYYTTNKSTPTVDSTLLINGGSFTLPFDGETIIKAIAYNGKCSNSGIVDKTVYVERTKPEVSIEISNPIDPEGYYYDLDGNGISVQIKCNDINAKIYYTIDSSNPMIHGIEYTGTFNTYTNKICAVAYGVNIGYSTIVEIPDIVIGRQRYINKPEILLNSENKADEFSEYSLYGQDVGWYGPTILVDDNAVYQSLVGILSTNLLEIPFRADFGNSLKSYIFKNTALMTSQEIISKLKNEIEFNDPRIYIDHEKSFAYFDSDSSQIIINLSWKNNNTGEMAMLKYGFNLDGIL